MKSPHDRDLSTLLTRIEAGEKRPSDELAPLVYYELRQLARVLMARERSETPQPTELVHEAYMRLGGAEGADWKSRGYFYAAAAEAMRRILVERARRRMRRKHGGGLRRVPLSEATVDRDTDPGELIDLDRALDELEDLAPRVVQVVKLRYFAGLTVEETARALETSTRTVKRDWRRARQWLYLRLKNDSEPEARDSD